MSKNKKIAIIIILVSLVIAGVCILAFIYPHKNTKVEMVTKSETLENVVQEPKISEEQIATTNGAENNSEEENVEGIASTEIIENAVEQEATEQENLESNSSMETKTNNTAKINKNSNDNQQKTSKTQSSNNTQKSNSSTSKTTTQAQSTKTTTKVETQQAKAETQKVETQPAKVETKKVETRTQSKPVQEQQVLEEKPVVQRCTNNSNHGIEVGNCDKWYSSKSEAVSAYNSKISEWGSKWENGEIDNETYYKNCPYGYEVWSCPYCNKWTINYYYR